MKKIICFAMFLALSLPSLGAYALTLAVEDAWEPYANPDGTGMSVEIVTGRRPLTFSWTASRLANVVLPDDDGPAIRIHFN